MSDKEKVKELYHIGESLKNLGRKWFAFSLLEESSFTLTGRVRGGAY